jgi:hypothetical protein
MAMDKIDDGTAKALVRQAAEMLKCDVQEGAEPIGMQEMKPSNVMPNIFDCGCSRLKVSVGKCSVYDENGNERTTAIEEHSFGAPEQKIAIQAEVDRVGFVLPALALAEARGGLIPPDQARRFTDLAVEKPYETQFVNGRHEVRFKVGGLISEVEMDRAQAEMEVVDPADFKVDTSSSVFTQADIDRAMSIRIGEMSDPLKRESPFRRFLQPPSTPQTMRDSSGMPFVALTLEAKAEGSWSPFSTSDLLILVAGELRISPDLITCESDRDDYEVRIIVRAHFVANGSMTFEQQFAPGKATEALAKVRKRLPATAKFIVFADIAGKRTEIEEHKTILVDTGTGEQMTFIGRGRGWYRLTGASDDVARTIGLLRESIARKSAWNAAGTYTRIVDGEDRGKVQIKSMDMFMLRSEQGAMDVLVELDMFDYAQNFTIPIPPVKKLVDGNGES